MEQALSLGQGAEALASYALVEDKNSTDTPRDAWAEHYGPVDVEAGVTIEADVGDEQGKFNLNSLLKADGSPDPDALKVFRRLLELCELEPRWASMVVDWIDPDIQPQSDGGEDSLYMSQTPPHRAGNLPLTSVSELQQIPGFTRELYLRLLPHVTALPPDMSRINVCTADGLVLDALHAIRQNNPDEVEFSKLTPEEMTRRRQSGCFPGAGAMGSNEPQVAARVAERSSYFRLRTWVRIGTAEFALYSLLYRDGSGQVRPILRTMGTD
jgi:general secretion pathway protein K